MTVRFAPDIAAMRRLVAVARRSQPADLVVTSGALLDVYTEEILEGWGLVIAEGRSPTPGPTSRSSSRWPGSKAGATSSLRASSRPTPTSTGWAWAQPSRSSSPPV